MNYSNLIKIALSALWRNKFRAFLTMLGIIMGVAAVIVVLAIGYGSKKSIQDQISSMGSNLVIVFPGSQFRGGVRMGTNRQTLTLEDVDAIRKECPSISMVSPEVRSGGQVIYGHQNAPTTIFGGNTDYLHIKDIKVESGRMFTQREVRSAAKVCLIGHTVITNLFGNSGIDPVGQVIRFNSIPIKIIGVLQAKGQNTFGQDQDDLLIAPYTTVQKRILGITYIHAILGSAVSESQSSSAVDEIESVLRARHKIKSGEEDDFRVRSQEELVQTFSTISNVLTVLLGAIAIISLLIGGIGIMNIMYVSVTERTREIGLRMSIGGRGIDIKMQFLTESILLSVLGGIIGILIGMGASKIVAVAMKWPVIVAPQSVVLAFLVCVIIGIFFGWYPAQKAANLDPIDALRYE